MSVTNLNEIDKADVLVAGLRKNLEEVKKLGITTDAINRLEEASKALRQKDAEVDELRRRATLKAHENLELNGLSSAYKTNGKHVLTQNSTRPQD